MTLEPAILTVVVPRGGAQLLGAVAVLVAVAAARVGAGWRRSGNVAHGGLITGTDNRYSTSKVVALGWTFLVAWMVVTEAITAATDATTSFVDLLKDASPLYLVFLGGPWAAAAFAKLSTQSKVSQGKLTKSPGTPSAGDVVADDDGNVDLYDFQYTLFNLVAILIVLGTFLHRPGDGLPPVPEFLAILTGGSALTYTVNKSISADGPQITSIDPSNARVGDEITISGTQLFSKVAGSALPTVTIGGISAVGVKITSTDTLVATVADAPAGTKLLSGQVDVVVTPAAGSPVVQRNGVTVIPDVPALTAVKPDRFKAGRPLTVVGACLLPPGTPRGVAVPGNPPGGLAVELFDQTNGAWDVDFDGPFSNTELGLKVGVQPSTVSAHSGEKQKGKLVLTRSALRVEKEVEYEVS